MLNIFDFFTYLIFILWICLIKIMIPQLQTTLVPLRAYPVFHLPSSTRLQLASPFSLAGFTDVTSLACRSGKIQFCLITFRTCFMWRHLGCYVVRFVVKWFWLKHLIRLTKKIKIVGGLNNIDMVTCMSQKQVCPSI